MRQAPLEIPLEVQAYDFRKKGTKELDESQAVHTWNISAFSRTALSASRRGEVRASASLSLQAHTLRQLANAWSQFTHPIWTLRGTTRQVGGAS